MTIAAMELIRERVKRVDALPTIPAILRPLLHYLEQPMEQLEMEKIVELVSCDESIAAQCLQMTNSPLYGRRQSVNTVRGAIIALGVRRLRDILLSCCLVRLVPREKWLIDPAAFWQHSFGCALVSRHFAQKIRYHDPEKAYLAGLLHDLGEVVNSISLPEEFRAAAELAVGEKISFYEAENVTLGFSHCETGDMLAEHWKLPEQMRQVILYHHDVEQAKLHAVLVAIVSLSDMFCRMRGLGYGYDESWHVDFSEDPAWFLLTNEYPYLADFDVVRFTFEVEGFVEQVRNLVASVFPRL